MGDNLKMEEHNLVKWHLMGPFDPSTQQWWKKYMVPRHESPWFGIRRLKNVSNTLRMMEDDQEMSGGGSIWQFGMEPMGQSDPCYMEACMKSVPNNSDMLSAINTNQCLKNSSLKASCKGIYWHLKYGSPINHKLLQMCCHYPKKEYT
jgi:hypothetical protein